MKTILLIGSNGMLGQALNNRLRSDGYILHCISRTDAEYAFDLVDDKRIEKCFYEVRPDIVINSAANTDLNNCEIDRGNAYEVNGRLPGILAAMCNEYGCYFVQVSTDHFFCDDGKKQHDEQCSVKLLNEYAKTKFIGEQLALLYNNTLVLRTNIVGFRDRKRPTFLEWALNELEQNRKLTLFSDFYTSSMCTTDFAHVLSDLLPLHPTGIYNLASSEVSSKTEFILGLSREIFGSEPNYKEGSVKNINGVPRGNSLGLETKKIEDLLGYKMPGLQETLSGIKREYLERKQKNEL